MWKALLAFISHRILLFIAALLTINASIPTERSGGLPRLHPTSTLWEKFVSHLERAPEIELIERARQMPSSIMLQEMADPFVWLSRWLCDLAALSPLASILLLSNLFFLAFLSQFHSLLSRLVTSDVMVGAVLLAVVWPTSYETSLGAPIGLSLFLFMSILKGAIDNQWLIVGFGCALLLISDPIVLGLLPFLLYVFWYYQRHYLMPQILKRVCFFMIPFGLAVLWKWKIVTNVGDITNGSALMDLVRAFSGRGTGWLFSQNYAGQTATAIFCLIGAGISLFSNTLFMHRVLPLFSWLALLLFSPFSGLASRGLFAALCLEGVSTASSPAVERAILITLLGLGIYDVVRFFSIVV